MEIKNSLKIHNEDIDLQIENLNNQILKYIESGNHLKNLKDELLRKCLNIETIILDEFEKSSMRVAKKAFTKRGKKYRNIRFNKKNFLELEAYYLPYKVKNTIISLRTKYRKRINRIKKIEEDLRRIYPQIKSHGLIHDEIYEKVNWQILPNGELSFGNLINYYSKLKKENPYRIFLKERLDFIEKLNPSKRYIGLGEFKGYVVYIFNYSTKAILENPYKGNAIYVLNGDWRSLSQMTKSELLDSNLGHVQRIIHSGDWFEKLEKALQE